MATAVSVVIALIVGFGAGLIWKIPQPKLTTDPNQRMQLWKAVTLLAYLLAATSLTAYAVYALWSPEPVGGDRAGEPACTSAGNPFLASLNPETLSVGSSVNEIFLRGCSFPSSIKVKFNGADRPSTWADAHHIRVSLSPADISTVGISIVSIFLGPTEYGSTYLRVVPATYSWRFYPGGPWTITQEVQFLLLVLFTGAFGSSVYALKSLGDYLGQAKLSEGWFTFYLIQPFEGSGSAFLLYLVIRGGFLGTGTDLKAVNIFGICAIAGLAGAFSDMAFAKLREVFETLFKPKEDRSGGIGPVNSSLKIATTSLPDGDFKNQVAYNQTLEPAGGTGPYKWSVSPNLPKGLTLEADHGTIVGIPAEATAKVRYTFTVTDSAQASAAAEFEIAML